MYLRSHQAGRALRLPLLSLAVAVLALSWLAPADTQGPVVASAVAVGLDYPFVLGSASRDAGSYAGNSTDRTARNSLINSLPSCDYW